MKKIIVFILIISIFCLSGCQKYNPVISDNSSVIEHDDVSSIDVSSIIDSNLDMSSNQPSDESTLINSSQDNNNLATDNESTNTTTENVDDDTSSDIEEKIVRPEKVTAVYNFNMNTAGTEHLKKTFYDTQNGNTLQYCLFLPDNYSADKKYPVILFLHGAGEIGTDNTTQLNNIRNMFTNNADYVAQSILICPQTSEWWRLDRESYGDRKGTLASALHLLQEIQDKYSCDENRIYLTGLSMGGYATWELLEHYGDIFAVFLFAAMVTK